MTIIIGLTGGVASGKTTISNFLKKQNIPVHDSDAVVTSLYKNFSIELVCYLRSIGLAKAIKQKKIDKNVLRGEVLNNKSKLKKLEKFVHKKVKLSRNKFIKKNKLLRKKIITLDVPLLFENKLENICDYIFLAYSPLKLRVFRALRRKNMSKNTLNKIIKLQMPDKLKITKSDFVINTATDKTNSNKQALEAIRAIKSIKY